MATVPVALTWATLNATPSAVPTRILSRLAVRQGRAQWCDSGVMVDCGLAKGHAGPHETYDTHRLRGI